MRAKRFRQGIYFLMAKISLLLAAVQNTKEKGVWRAFDAPFFLTPKMPYLFALTLSGMLFQTKPIIVHYFSLSYKILMPVVYLAAPDVLKTQLWVVFQELLMVHTFDRKWVCSPVDIEFIVIKSPAGRYTQNFAYEMISQVRQKRRPCCYLLPNTGLKIKFTATIWNIYISKTKKSLDSKELELHFKSASTSTMKTAGIMRVLVTG